MQNVSPGKKIGREDRDMGIPTFTLPEHCSYADVC